MWKRAAWTRGDQKELTRHVMVVCNRVVAMETQLNECVSCWTGCWKREKTE